MTCFEKGIYGENKSKDDFKLNDSLKSSATQGSVWTEAETFLLLESVLKHGDDWELVAQNVQTKTKLECISRLIELPFGELMLGSHGKVSARGLIDEVDTSQGQKASSEPNETKNTEADRQDENNVHHEGDLMQDNHQRQEIIEREKSMEIESVEPPTKKKRVDSSDPSRSLIEQVCPS